MGRCSGASFLSCAPSLAIVSHTRSSAMRTVIPSTAVVARRHRQRDRRDGHGADRSCSGSSSRQTILCLSRGAPGHSAASLAWTWRLEGRYVRRVLAVRTIFATLRTSFIPASYRPYAVNGECVHSWSTSSTMCCDTTYFTQCTFRVYCLILCSVNVHFVVRDIILECSHDLDNRVALLLPVSARPRAQ